MAHLNRPKATNSTVIPHGAGQYGGATRPMKTVIFFCYVAIIIGLTPTAHGQLPTAANSRLDSILQTGRPEVALEYWTTVCRLETEDSSKAAGMVTAEQLQSLLGFVALFEAQTPAYKSELIADSKSQSESYKESYAGPAAARAFQSFLDAADRGDRLNAIIFFRTARFFKISYLKKILAEAHSNYIKADKQFDEGMFESADSTLKANRYEAGNHPALMAYADTLGYLQQRVDGKLQEIAKWQFYWERTDSVDSKLSFSLSTRIVNQPGNNAFPLVMSNANFTLQVDVDRIIPTYRFGLGLQTWYRLNERTSVGVGVDVAKFSYSSVHTTQLIFFDFDVAYSRAFVEGKYLLRSAVGLRPYLNFGLGVMRYKYDQFNAVIYRESSGYVTYQVAADDFTSGNVSFTIGTQFVPKSSSSWAISSELSWYIPFREHEFLPLPRLSIGMQIDLLM